MEYYYNEDKTKVGVLVSHGFGAGWSSWHDEALAYDKRVVDFWLEHHSPEFCAKVSNNSEEGQLIKNFLKKCGYPNVYLGGYAQITLEWVDCGQPFRIDEYDGAESIELLSTKKWIVLR